MKLPWIDVADVGGLGDRDADAEALDGQAADDALGRVEDEARSLRRCGFRPGSARTCALLPSIAATWFGTDLISLGSERNPRSAVTRKTLGAMPAGEAGRIGDERWNRLARVRALERDCKCARD